MTDRDERTELLTDTGKSGAMLQADTANGEGPRDDTAGDDLALAREDRAPAATRVLLAVDDSEVSIRAAKVAHQLFGNDAKYFVINVGATEVMMPGGDPMTWGVPYPMVLPLAVPVRSDETDALHPDVPSAVDRAEAEARSVTEAAELPPHSVSLGATGDPVEQIGLAAADEAIDVIVVGSSSGGWWRHLLDPSVAKSVVRHADRPVLIVP